MPESVSYREFARRQGISDTAVRKGIKAGRLRASIDAAGAILDYDLAVREWQATSRREDPTVPAPPPAAAAPRTDGDLVRTDAPDGSHRLEATAPAPAGVVITADSLVEAQRLATIERARKLRLENDQAEGRLVPVDLVAKEAFEAQRIIREAMLNLPARISGELAAVSGIEASRAFMLVDRAIRDALNQTADRLLAVING